MRQLPTWPIAGGSLLLGFAVAQASGVRALGGVVLFVGALACGLRWRLLLGLPGALALVAAFLAAFAVSHPLGDVVGAWPAVLIVSAAVAALTWWAADRTTPTPAPRVRRR